MVLVISYLWGRILEIKRHALLQNSNSAFVCSPPPLSDPLSGEVDALTLKFFYSFIECALNVPYSGRTADILLAPAQASATLIDPAVMLFAVGATR